MKDYQKISQCLENIEAFMLRQPTVIVIDSTVATDCKPKAKEFMA